MMTSTMASPISGAEGSVGDCGKILTSKYLEETCICVRLSDDEDGTGEDGAAGGTLLTILCNKTDTMDHIPSLGKDDPVQAAMVQKL